MAGEILSVPNTAEVPPEASRDRETWQHFGIADGGGIPRKRSRGRWWMNILHWNGSQDRILDLCANVPIHFVIAGG